MRNAEIEWVVNDGGELGVKIGDRFFFCYKGRSLEYSGRHDDGTPMKWRPVGKREFGEVVHPTDLKGAPLLDRDGRYTRGSEWGARWSEMPHRPGAAENEPDLDVEPTSHPARNDTDQLRAEIRELRAAVVVACDTYSSNRNEKQRIKALRFVAAKGDGPFSLAAVDEELEQIERRDRDEVERHREALQHIADQTSDTSSAEYAREALRAQRPTHVQAALDSAGPPPTKPDYTDPKKIIAALSHESTEINQALNGEPCANESRSPIVSQAIELRRKLDAMADVLEEVIDRHDTYDYSYSQPTPKQIAEWRKVLR